MHFYTSINSNYLPKARVLAKSVKKHCPDAKFSLVYVDDIPEGIDMDREYFDEILGVEDLNIPVQNLKLWVFQHTVVELCTAIKGPALVKFLEEGSNKVVYLDPDIAVFDDLRCLDELMDRYDVILTPHQTLPDHNLNDIIHNEICSLQHGVYNYGFYAVRNTENGMKYARWWRDRLVDFCYDDIPGGLFTDQRWGDIAPCLFEGVYIWRDPGCNVSTWNLSTRKVTMRDGAYYVNGSKMKFYHFSGFDSGAQKIMLDKYSGGNPLLYELREWYIAQQDEQGQKIFGIGHGKAKFNYYDNGELISPGERKLLRQRQDLIAYFADTDPYVVEQSRSYYKWLAVEHKNEQQKLVEISQADYQYLMAAKEYYERSLLLRLKRFVKKVIRKLGGRPR